MEDGAVRETSRWCYLYVLMENRNIVGRIRKIERNEQRPITITCKKSHIECIQHVLQVLCNLFAWYAGIEKDESQKMKSIKPFESPNWDAREAGWIKLLYVMLDLSRTVQPQ